MLLEQARANPWTGARCLLAALGQRRDPLDSDEQHAEAQLVGARLLADGIAAVRAVVSSLT